MKRYRSKIKINTILVLAFISIAFCACSSEGGTENIDSSERILTGPKDLDPSEEIETDLDGLPNVWNDIIESDLETVSEMWEESYKSIICDIESNLADPYDFRFGSNGNIFIGIHDFDNDDIPELIVGDSVSVAVFTFENGNAVKVADLYEPEEWGGINGLYYKDNHLVLVNNGSGGSSYVCFTYDEGEYVAGVYDDYNPDKGVIDGKQVAGEAFRQQFDLAELTNNSRIEYSKIYEEDGIILVVNGKNTTIDDLDFRLLEWK